MQVHDTRHYKTVFAFEDVDRELAVYLFRQNSETDYTSVTFVNRNGQVVSVDMADWSKVVAAVKQAME